MSNEFNRIKKRFLIEAIIKSAACALSAGLFAVGAVLLGLKLGDSAINAGYYVLIGLGAAFAAGAPVFFLLRPSNVKIARRLDKEHGLNERVQTMVAFEGKEGSIYELQRKDASERLAALPKPKPDIKRLWHYAVIFVLSVALFAAALAVPSKAPPVRPEIPFEYSDRQREAVQRLISDVGETSLTEEDKTSVAAMLNAMSGNLENAKVESEMKTAVISAISLVDVLLYTSNSFDNVAYAVDGEKTEFFADAITDGVLFYRDSATPVTTLEQVTEFESGLENFVGDKVDMDMDVFVQQYDETLSDDIKEDLTKINEALEKVSDNDVASPEDAVRISVENFVKAMTEVAQNFDSYSENDFKNAVGRNVTAYKEKLVPALMPQSYRCLANEFVRKRAAQIFGLKTDELPRLQSGVKELDEKPDDGEDKNNNGGGGHGDSVYGSTEFVYDPDTGELTAYGKFINKYFAAMTEQLMNGNVPENVQEKIKEYFNTLFSGAQPKDEENKEE